MLLPSESLANFRDLVTSLQEGPVTAFIGAGLSASMQPTWRGLHAELQREAGIEPVRRFDADFAPADFADFRDVLGAERYLEIFKRMFAGVVADYPDHYRLLDETSGFEQLITTNYDEFLATVASSTNRAPHIAIYPILNDIGARYVYLHGRAETATAPNHLVVCEDDYGEAYNAPATAGNMLRAALGRPGVFFGSSLADPDLTAIIRSRARNPGPAGLNALPPLFAVVSVEPADDTDEAFTAAAEIDTRRLARLGVRAICFKKDEGYTQLRAVILELRHVAERRQIRPLFLERARELDRLGALATPTPTDVARVQRLIRGIPELAQHFFEHSADSPAWFDELKDSVIIPGAIDPWRFGEGGLRIAPWAAAPYVVRIAADRPDAIVELISRLSETRNWQVQSELTWAAARLPPAQFREVLPFLGVWTGSPYRQLSQVYIPLVRIARSLTNQDGDLEIALAILGYLLTPLEYSDERGLELRVVYHWLPQLEEPRDRLARDLPMPTYELLRDRLLSAIAAQADRARRSSYWRPAIEDSGHNHPHHDWQVQFLLDGTRDALLTWVEQDRDSAAREIDRLLDSEHGILRRLALHVLNAHPEVLPLPLQPVVSEGLLHNDEHFHELALLVSNHFADLDEASKQRVHDNILNGKPSLAPEPEEQRQRRLEYHRWRWLAVLPQEHQSEEERGWWESAQLRYGFPPYPHFLSGVGVPAHDGNQERQPNTEPDPVEVAWHDGGAPALLEALRERAGRLSTLARLISEDPESLLALAPLILPEEDELCAVYVGGYTTLVETATSSFQWGPLVELLSRVVEADRYARGELGFKTGRLIGSGATSQYNPIPPDLLDASLASLGVPMGSMATPLDADPIADSWRGRFHQLNSVVGIAADAFMMAVWRQMRYADGDERHLHDEARRWIDRALTEGWGGQEMRHALGQYGAVLEWGEPGWLAAHVDGLWPVGDDLAAINMRRMFLHGFLHADTWSIRNLEILFPMFQEAIQDLGRESPLYFDEPGQREQFCRHLAAGWLNEVERFDDLVDEFNRVSTDADRAIFVTALGDQFRFDSAGTGIDYTGTLAKRDGYWKQRVDALRYSLPVAERSEELSSFCSWPVRWPDTLRTLESRLRTTIDHLASGIHTADLLEYIAAHGEQEPLPALRLLNHLAERLFTDRDLRLWAHSRELEAALDAVCRGAKPHHRKLVRQLADHFIRGGLTAFARRVEECGERSRG